MAIGIPFCPRESHQGAQTYRSSGLHQHPLCPRHLAPLERYHKTVGPEEKSTLEKKCYVKQGIYIDLHIYKLSI